MKERYKTMRQKYSDLPSGSECPEDIDWEFMEKLSFLAKYVGNRKMTSTITTKKTK